MAAGQRLRGFVGQGMSGVRRAPKILTVNVFNVSGAFSVTNGTQPAVAEIWLIGAGGGGDAGADPAGGGGATYYKLPMGALQTISGVVGAFGATNPVGVDGGDTTALLPNGRALLAGGGRGASGAPGAGGLAQGGMINRPGSVSVGGFVGGNAAGFPESGAFLTGGLGGSNLGVAGASPGGGGGAQGNGGDGRAVIVLWRRPT